MPALTLALRSLRRAPAFSVLAISCLALGLGLATTAFAMLDAMVRPHVPYRDPERLFALRHRGDGAQRTMSDLDRIAALRTLDGLFTELVTVVPQGNVLVGTDRRVLLVPAATVGPELFPFLGVKMQRGRPLLDGDGDDGAIVVTDDLWKHFFAGRDLATARLTVEDRSYPVVGVLPPGMTHPLRSGVLLARRPGLEQPHDRRVLVRLQPGRDSAAVQAQLDALAQRLDAAHGRGWTAFDFRLHAVRADPFQLGPIHGALAGGAGAVLLIACANLANLLLARGLARRHDLVVHVALGATRGTVARQLVAEACLLAAAGAALGLVLTWWGAGILRSGIPERLQGVGVLQPQVSWRLFLFGVLAAAGAAALFGVAPALQASDVRAGEALKDGAGTTTRQRHRYSTVVIAEVALTLMLLVGAGLLVRTIRQIHRVDLGAAGANLVEGRVIVFADTGRVQRMVSPAARELLALAEAVPGVQVAATEDVAPAQGFQVVGEGHGGRPPLFTRFYARVSPSYVRTRGITIIAGRDFTEGDAGGAGAVILDSATAFKLWRDGDAAVGRLIKLAKPHYDTPWLRVVGISRPLVHFNDADPYEEPPPEIYVVEPGPATGRRLLVRVPPGREAEVALALSRAMRDGFPGRPVRAWFQPVRQRFDDFAAARAFIGRLFIGCAALALALAVTGLYAVIAHTVSRRMREFAIRVALGARPADVRRLVVRDAAVMILAGTAIGGLVGLWTGRFVDPWLYGVFYVDAVSLVAAELVLLLAAALAVAVPVRRALRANPVTIIRAI